jgi:hypothetical protein
MCGTFPRLLKLIDTKCDGFVKKCVYKKLCNKLIQQLWGSDWSGWRIKQNCVPLNLLNK